MSIAAFAVLYFLYVFAIGFVLGVVRTLWLVAPLGERAAELAELPVMVIASYFVARFLLRSRGHRFGVGASVAAGLGALALLAGAEIATVIVLRAQNLSDYVAARDPVAGTAYLIALASFAAMPALVAASRRRRKHENGD